jgi:response regulator of citrate/malate metabolism
MIRTLVVDDDYRVARIHAASVNRVPGFECVGEAHTAGQALEFIAAVDPDLLLLDLYLPDQDGLSVMRALTVSAGRVPDCIVVTAARDIEAVRTAMQLGAVYYLVKPFGFAALRDQLETYRRWREQLERTGEADQAAVDNLYDLRRAPKSPTAHVQQLPPTMAKVLDVVRAGPKSVSALEVAEAVGVSRPTAQRHLNDLVRRGLIQLDLAYGSTGRPTHLYRSG